jgi:hypothetical protein
MVIAPSIFCPKTLTEKRKLDTSVVNTTKDLNILHQGVLCLVAFALKLSLDAKKNILLV